MFGLCFFMVGYARVMKLLCYATVSLQFASEHFRHGRILATSSLRAAALVEREVKPCGQEGKREETYRAAALPSPCWHKWKRSSLSAVLKAYLPAMIASCAVRFRWSSRQVLQLDRGSCCSELSRMRSGYGAPDAILHEAVSRGLGA